jgi:hypothetical protein
VKTEVFGGSRIGARALGVIRDISPDLVPLCLKAIADGTNPDSLWLFVIEQDGEAISSVLGMDELDRKAFDDVYGNAIRTIARKPRMPGFMRVVFMLADGICGGEIGLSPTSKGGSA